MSRRLWLPPGTEYERTHENQGAQDGHRDRDPGAGQTSDGERQDEASQAPIPARYIDRMSFDLNGKLIEEARLGPNVDANPLTAIRIENVRSGDKVAVGWIDNRGEGDRVETTVR
jgi:sulfur-oxidizing protein SoxZ